MTPKLEVRGVDYSYHTMEGETKALSDISFHVNPGVRVWEVYVAFSACRAFGSWAGGDSFGRGFCREGDFGDRVHAAEGSFV